MTVADYRDIAMIAGSDPCAYKGTENRAEAHIRPSKQGGCVIPDQNLKESLET